MPTRLARGQLVGERYRLETELGRGSGCVTWKALDERLDRTVALRLFESGIDRGALTKRAGLAASLTHPRVVRVFDTGEDAGRFFTVSELLPASLRTVRLPLAVEHMLQTAIDIAEALQHAHERDVVHGNLHEGNVLLSDSGAKVGDFALSGSTSSTRGDDLVAFGAMLRRIAGAAPPPSLIPVMDRLSAGTYERVDDALDDLRRLRPTRPVVVPRQPRRGWLVAAIITVLVGIAAFGATQLGDRSRGRETRFAPGGRIDGTPLRPSGVIDFDPLGDQREGQRTIANVADGDSQTFWSTERYESGPKFSGLKSGVGVIFDLGRASIVGRAQLLFPKGGCSFEVRHSDNRSASINEWPVAARVRESPPSAPIIFEQGANARYWLVWITGLATGVPGAGSQWACAVSEVDLYAP